MLKHKMKMAAVLASLAGALLFAPSFVPLEGKAVAATAKETETVRSAIQAAYARANAAASRKDVEAFMSLRTSDFVWTSKNGKRKGYAQTKADAARLFAAAESLSGTTIVEKITLHGNDKATIAIYDTGTIVMRVSETEKRVMKVTERASSTWVKRNGKWLCSQSTTLSASITVNGKSVAY